MAVFDSVFWFSLSVIVGLWLLLLASSIHLSGLVCCILLVELIWLGWVIVIVGIPSVFIHLVKFIYLVLSLKTW